MDSLCSFVISLLILYSTWPVLKNSTKTLLHFLPEKIMKKKEKMEYEILKISHKFSIQEMEVWVLNEDKIVVELKLIIEKDEEINKESDANNKREIRSKINKIFKANEVKEYFIQMN